MKPSTGGSMAKARSHSSSAEPRHDSKASICPTMSSRPSHRCRASCGQVAQRDCESRLATRFICPQESRHIRSLTELLGVAGVLDA